MAAPVDESKLLNLEIKTEMKRLAESMTRERILQLQNNVEPASSDERLYVRLFKIMCDRGLKGACTPPQSSVRTIRPMTRLIGQQHHQNLRSGPTSAVDQSPAEVPQPQKRPSSRGIPIRVPSLHDNNY